MPTHDSDPAARRVPEAPVRVPVNMQDWQLLTFLHWAYDADAVQALLPPGLKQGGEDLKRNLRAAVSAQLDRLDLVTREEFEVQRAVLMRTREKLEALERAVAALEAERAGTPPSAPN